MSLTITGLERRLRLRALRAERLSIARDIRFAHAFIARFERYEAMGDYAACARVARARAKCDESTIPFQMALYAETILSLENARSRMPAVAEEAR